MKAQHPIAHRMVETSSSELTFCRFGELLEETIHGRAGRAGGRELPRVLLLLEAAMFHHCNWGSSGGACSECYTPADPLHGLKKAAKTTQKSPTGLQNPPEACDEACHMSNTSGHVYIVRGMARPP